MYGDDELMIKKVDWVDQEGLLWLNLYIFNTVHNTKFHVFRLWFKL